MPASLSNLASHTASLTNAAAALVNQLLLTEDGFYLLMEDGSFFKIEQSVASGATVTNQPAS